MTDYKDLCGDLLNCLNGLYEELIDAGAGWIPPEAQELMNRAWEAMAEPRPVLLNVNSSPSPPSWRLPMLEFTPEQQAAIEAACAQHLQDCRVSATSDEPPVSNDREPAFVTPQATAALAEPELEKLTRKTLIINPVQIVECGGPCFEDGPEACDCGALWRDEPMSQPEPQPTTGESSTVQPADWEVTELVDWLRDAAKEAASADCVTDAWWLTHAAELLERLSPQPPANGEVAELAASLERMSIEADAAMQLSDSEVLGRAAGLLERLSPPLP